VNVKIVNALILAVIVLAVTVN